MSRDSLTAVELLVLRNMVGDAHRQIVVLTSGYHGPSFNPEELQALRQIADLIYELDRSTRLLDAAWRVRVAGGKESNRSDTGGADAAGPARPGDDVPPSTSR